MPKYNHVDIISGEERVKPLRELVLESCCDCGLTHAVFYNIIVEKGKRVITKMMYRDAFATADARAREKK